MNELLLMLTCIGLSFLIVILLYYIGIGITNLFTIKHSLKNILLKRIKAEGYIIPNLEKLSVKELKSIVEVIRINKKLIKYEMLEK